MGTTWRVAAIAVAVAAPAHAERPEDRAWLQGGVFRASIDTYARIDNQALGIEGDRIDFEGDLGLDNREWLPKAAGGLRLGRRFRAEVDHFALDRRGSATLDDLLGIDDTIFPAGAEVDSRFSTDIWRIALGWSPVRTEKAEVGIALGMHLTDAKFRLEADVPVEGVTVTLAEGRSATIPLPNIGVYGTYNLSRIWAVHGRVDVLSLKVGDYKGQLVDVQAGVSARIRPRLGLGLAYRFVDYDLEARRDDWQGKLEYRYKGPLAFVELGF